MPGNWGEILQNSVAGAFGGGDAYLRDFTHASKTFRADSYANAPKFKFLFHTYFNINPQAVIPYTMANLGSVDIATNFGLLVKEVKLPSFSFGNQQLNQYNRKRIVQTKIKYENVDVTFHDDNNSTITQMWEAYYTYYYNDGMRPGSMFKGSRGASSLAITDYNVSNIYDPSISGDEDWGFSGGQTNQEDGRKVPFFKNITIFGFNQHSFVAYTLVNPVINSFSHDTYNYETGNGIMENRMSLDYETVVYNYGDMDGESPENIVTGFGDPATYDRELSPISPPGSNAMTLGKGGLVYGDGGSLRSPISDDYYNSMTASDTAYNTEKFPDLQVSIDNELNVMIRNAIGNKPVNRNSLFDFPSAGSSPGPYGTADSPAINGLTDPIDINEDPLYDDTYYSPDADFEEDIDPAWEEASNNFGNFIDFPEEDMAGEQDIFGDSSDPFTELESDPFFADTEFI